VDDLDFLSALGEEFCESLSPPVPGNLIVPQDGYEVWLKAFGTDPSPAALAALTNDATERLRMACVEYFECPTVSVSQLRAAVARTLVRWPAAPTDPR
jgi:hypothetical protein